MERRWQGIKFGTWRWSALVLGLAGLVGPAVDSAFAESQGVEERGKSFLLNNGVRLAQGVAAGERPEQLATTLAENSIRYFLPGIGADAPDWAKRIEFDWRFGQDQKPEYSILTVQPLWRSEENVNTLFTQLSHNRYQMFDEYRNTSNIGLGYRRLLDDNQAMVGINTFYDHEWTRRHRRMSIGAEVKMHMLDFHANRYLGLSNEVDAKGDFREKALDGWDAELRSQLPYLPWASIGAQYFRWEKHKAAEDMDGWTFSGKFDLTQNLLAEIGHTDDNYSSGRWFVRLTFRLADTKRPTATSSRLVDDKIFAKRDMSSHTLDRVRRENKIVVERVSSGVVISRGD